MQACLQSFSVMVKVAEFMVRRSATKKDGNENKYLQFIQGLDVIDSANQ